MRCAIIGYGNVGKASHILLSQKAQYIKQAYGVEIRVVAVADIMGSAIHEKGLKPEDLIPYAEKHGTVALSDYGLKGFIGPELLQKVKPDLVIEVTPTNIVNGEPGLSYIMTAIDIGAHVVTTNKGPFALKYREIMDKAKKQGVLVKLTGAVGGATRVLKYAEKCLAGEDIEDVRGILNGTTNYILTRMEEGISFEEALREAQRMGIAEADPTYDVEGIDAACKIAILANALLNENVTVHDISREGISKITKEDVAEALKSGETIKLIASAKELSVKPARIPVNHPLNVKGTLNAITFQTKNARELTIVGPGAGRFETASTVISDVIDIIESLRRGLSEQG
ncbi:MAG: homoserine dehydrogenase [Candidatus Methanomethylicota archaeon]|uniref:Homoserine dehydrogenase n=1 Tax=Thermoproteota archaeon TaxID=2056631 RepID=A0A497EP99_9CREN|nr:MAG: homoserine dehydrogenase [Candidatus Verstraetearchaeota archaeon]